MGVYVHLAVIAERVSDSMWDVIYEKARRVARRWTPPPLSLAWRDIGAVQVAQYTPEYENEAGMHIVGDAATLTTGESFMFPRTLGARPSSYIRSVSPAEPARDVLVAVALRNAGPARRQSYRNLFGNKTQGFPYHTLIVALGLLVESSLPGIAVVYGDIDAKDGEQARRGLSAILAEQIELPVVLNGRLLRQRLSSALDPEELEYAVGELAPDTYSHAALADLLGLLRSAPRARVQHELEHVVCACREPELLAPETRAMLRSLREAIQSAMRGYEIRHRVEEWGSVRTRELLARQTQTRMRFTFRTWDAIEVADLDELAFVYTAVCVDNREWRMHHAIRALIENHAMRRI